MRMGRRIHPNWRFELPAAGRTVEGHIHCGRRQHMNLSVMRDLAADATGTVAARSAVLVCLGETWLTAFGADLPGGVIDDEAVYSGVRMDQAGAFARIDDMIVCSDIAVLSDADLAWLRPGDHPSDAVRWLMSRGPAILVVTHGETAATGYAKSRSVCVRGQRDLGHRRGPPRARLYRWVAACADRARRAGRWLRAAPPVDRRRRPAGNPARCDAAGRPMGC